MKRVITKFSLAIIILLIGFQANAQEKKFNFGLKIAPAISWLNIEYVGDVASGGAVPKFNWGFTGIYNVSENFGIVSGFNVNALGGNIKYNNDIEGPPSPYKYSEIQIPLLFQMKSNEILNFHIFAQLGLAGGFFLKAKDNEDRSIEKETTALNSAFIIAAGIYYPIIGDMNLMAQFKYNAGLNNISRSDNFNDKIKTSFVELSLGVMF